MAMDVLEGGGIAGQGCAEQILGLFFILFEAGAVRD
jgi:hypothetical protein